MDIKLTTNETDLDRSALLMFQSEPFVTLKFELEKCKMAMRGDHKEVYIATVNGDYAGFVVIQLYGLMRGYIQTLCVTPKYRGKGVGTALLKHCEEHLFKQFPNVFICVSSFNYGAQKLYYRLGFEKIGELKDHIVKGHDEYILRKQLCPTSEFKPM